MRLLPILLLSLSACAAPTESFAPSDFEVVKVEYAIAGDLAQSLAQLLVDDPGDGAHVIADARTNSLLLSGEPQRIDQLKQLIATLDVEQ